VVGQEVAVASGAGSQRQEDGEVAREEGDNGEGLGRWEDLPEEEEGRPESEGLICNFRNFQGLLCKGKIPVDTKA
jgi:hypothetical protein